MPDRPTEDGKPPLLRTKGRGLRIDARASNSSDAYRAASVGYRRGRDSAPRVVRKGAGDAARRIVEQAERDGIPIERDPDLLQSLAHVEVGDEIPEEAFVAVAEILAFLYDRNASFESDQ